MEEAIAVLEKRVEIDRMIRDGSVESDYDKFCENECLAIEKLIKGYRDSEDILKETVKENLELKEYIRELEEEKDAYRYQLNSAFNNGFIHKSKIKEKIEEYEQMKKATYTDLTHYGDLRRDTVLEVLQVLQELMEDTSKGGVYYE